MHLVRRGTRKEGHTKNTSIKEALYYGECNKKQRTTSCVLHPRQPAGQESRSKHQSLEDFAVLPRRGQRSTWSCAGNHFKFLQALSGSVICFDTNFLEFLTMVILMCDKAQTYTNTRVAVSCSPLSRNSDTAPWKRKTGSTLAVVVGKGTMLDGTLSVKQTPETNWSTSLTRQTLELQKKGNFEEGDKAVLQGVTIEGVAKKTYHWYHVLSMRCNTQQLYQGLERKAEVILGDGFPKIRALTQLEIILQRLRGTFCGQRWDQDQIYSCQSTSRRKNEARRGDPSP